MKIKNVPFTVVDIETTGASLQKDRVIEIGAVKVVNGKIVDTFQTLVNPGRRIPFFITWMTGISNRMVHRAPQFEKISYEFQNFLGESIFVAHNVGFDFEFLKSEFYRSSLAHLSNLPLCTIKLARRVFPGFSRYNLTDLSNNLGIHRERRHRALDDSLAAAKILLLIFERLAKHGMADFSDLERIYQSSPQECRDHFARLAYAG